MRARRSPQEREQFHAEALHRATTSQALSNLPVIFSAFMERGIPEAEIRPRENVFTFNAWKALGRYVRKGEKGVAVVTWIDTPGKRDPENPEATTGGHRFAKRTHVFHISQTEPAAR